MILHPSEVNPFTPPPQRRPQLFESGHEYVKYLRSRYGTGYFALNHPMETADIGPIRLEYYALLVGMKRPQDWFPFGSYVPLLDIPLYRPYGKYVTDPDEWLENDVYLKATLSKLGVRWWPLEWALWKAFVETDNWQEDPGPHYITGRHHTLARIAMFHHDPDRQNIIQAASQYTSLLNNPSLSLSGRDRLNHLAWKWNWEDFCSLSDVPKQLTNYSTVARSPYVTPVVQAIARTLRQKLDTKKEHSPLPQELRRILFVRSEYDPDVIEDLNIVRNEFWQLIAAIFNHLSTTIAGVRLSNPTDLSAGAIRQRCGATAEQIAYTLRY